MCWALAHYGCGLRNIRHWHHHWNAFIIIMMSKQLISRINMLRMIMVLWKLINRLWIWWRFSFFIMRLSSNWTLYHLQIILQIIFIGNITLWIWWIVIYWIENIWLFRCVAWYFLILSGVHSVLSVFYTWSDITEIFLSFINILSYFSSLLYITVIWVTSKIMIFLRLTFLLWTFLWWYFLGLWLVLVLWGVLFVWLGELLVIGASSLL